MAIVEYKDNDGTVHWADENSKAYEKHLRDKDANPELSKSEPAKAEFKSPAAVTAKPKD